MKPKKNQRHEVEITDVTAKGFGVGFLEDFAVFVDGTLTGERVLAHIVKVKARYAYGKIAQIITPSPHRIESPCKVSAQCGGCQWQHCTYEAQLEFKKNIVRSALEKLGGQENPPVFDVIGMENPMRYRNKAVFPVVPAGEPSPPAGKISPSTPMGGNFSPSPQGGEGGGRRPHSHSPLRGECGKKTAAYGVEGGNAFPLSPQGGGSEKGADSPPSPPLGGGQKKESFAIGMYAPRSHRLVEVSDCIIQHEAHVGVLAAVKEHMRRHKISAYDETTHQGCVRHIVVRTSIATGEVMAVIVVNTPLAAATELSAALTAQGVTTMLVNQNPSRGNTIFGENFETISGAGFIREKIGEIEYRISAPSFFQVNPVQTKVLYETAMQQAGLHPTGKDFLPVELRERAPEGRTAEGEPGVAEPAEAGKGAIPSPPWGEGAKKITVVDAHCGAGGIALFAAKQGANVIGVDIAKSSILDARENAARNGITNAEFICGAAEDILPKILTGEEIIFLDPPRKGCDPILLDALIAAQVRKIVYISCDPATLARDIKHLTAAGYKLTAAQPVDMFPFTGKVEVVSVLRRSDTPSEEKAE